MNYNLIEKFTREYHVATMGKQTTKAKKGFSLWRQPYILSCFDFEQTKCGTGKYCLNRPK